jgi:hypothetical protein
MKPRLILCLVLIFGNALLGCSSPGRKTSTASADQPPVTLGVAFFYFKHDEAAGPSAPPYPNTLSLIWTSGRHFTNDDGGCNSVGEQYSGKFIFRVELTNGMTVDTRLETLYTNGDFDFILAQDTQPWRIFTADYNNDGQPDFNIITPCCCNYDNCYLFTVTLSGRVEALKIEGPDSLMINRTGDPSTEELGELTPGGFYHESFDVLERVQTLEFLDWDANQKIFHSREEKIPLRK